MLPEGGDIMLIPCNAVSLEPLKYEDKTICLELVKKCPICQTTITPKPLYTTYRVEKSVIYIESSLLCTNCNHSFISRYVGVSDDNYNIFRNTLCIDLSNPVLSSVHLFDKKIDEISPKFNEIYKQALAAEVSNLNEIAGLGYRKSLEFLIKDIAIQKKPDDAETIKRSPLAHCIKEYFDDELKTLAERCTWIGNDEAHYVRKHEDRDIKDLKKFIHSIVNIVLAELTAEDAASIKPK